MAPRKTAKEFFRKGRERGSTQCQKGIDGSVVFGKLTPKVESDYNRMVGLWNQFAEEHAEDNPDPYDVKSLKQFVKDVAFGIEGAMGDPNPAMGTVKVYWKQFTAGWRRNGVAIPRNISTPVTNFIKYELPDILKEESSIKLVETKRARRFGTRNHFIHLGRQLWANDWFKYERPGIRVYIWACFMAMVCSSARIGEYIESSCRPTSDRGLYYKDVTFGVFRNEHGDVEFGVQLVRDAKNMTDESHKKPEHVLYEGITPMPLICNALLPILAIALSERAFRDFDTIEALLDVVPPEEGEMFHLRWKDSMLDQPFFKSMSSRRGERKIETAGTVSKRLHNLGIRAGYAKPPTIHDFRAEGLYWIDKLYSAAQRQKHAGHKNPQTYSTHYQPNNSGTDGQGSYFGLEVREIVNDLFRGTTVERNPDLPQSLTAEKLETLENSAAMVAIQTEIAALQGQHDDETRKRRAKLYRDRKKLKDNELSRWQHSQRDRRLNTGKDTTPTPCYDRGVFARVKFLMPERERLATILFETHTLRSPTGLEALRDMVALCEADAEVIVRPGLEPIGCRCSGESRRRKVPGSSTSQDTCDWKHVYKCFRNANSDFVDFCFLCSAWVYGEKEWTEHCSQHLACPDELPAQCDPLLYGGVLATAGYCMFCMADTSLSPEARLHHFVDKRTWQQHVHGHYNAYIQTISDQKLIICPHPGMRCDAVFDSVAQFKFHMLDCHCHDLIRASIEPSSAEDVEAEDAETATSSKRERTAESDVKEANFESEYCFVDEAVELARRYGPGPASVMLPVEDPASPDSCIVVGGYSSYPPL